MFANPSKVNHQELMTPYVDDKGEVRDPLNIDQSMTIKGNENSFGFPESDVALMLKAQSQDEIAYYMSKMRDMRVNDDSNRGLTDEQIAIKVIPCGMNTPVSYANAVKAAQQYFLEVAEAEAKANAQSSETHVESVVEASHDSSET